MRQIIIFFGRKNLFKNNIDDARSQIFAAQTDARRRLISSVYRIFNIIRLICQKDFARERREKKKKPLNIFYFLFR